MSTTHTPELSSSPENNSEIIGIPFSPHEVIIGEASPVPQSIEDLVDHLTTEEKLLAVSGLHRRYKYAQQVLISEKDEENAALVERVVEADTTTSELGAKLVKLDRLVQKYKSASERGEFGNLYNKRTFNRLGKRLIDHDRRVASDYPKIVVFSDIDRLDLLNAYIGETVVDTEILDPTAKVFGRKSRIGSVLTGLMGGDEYAQIIQGMSIQEAVRYLSAQQRAVNAIRVNKSFAGAEFIEDIGLTIAYAIVQPGESFKDVMSRADRAKKYAKEVTGRNSIINADSVPKDWVYVKKARVS